MNTKYDIFLFDFFEQFMFKFLRSVRKQKRLLNNANSDQTR